MPRLPKHIAVTAGMVAAVGTFGAGAYALSQGGAAFDPSAFIAAYDRGTQDRQKGYQSNPTESDADANRSDDGDDRDRGTDADNTADRDSSAAPSSLPIEGGSGTTAVRVTGDGSGTGVNVADGSGTRGTGTVVSGPVIPNNGGNADGGTGDDHNGGGQGGGQGGGGSTVTPTENSYRVLPSDPTPSEKKPTAWAELVGGDGSDNLQYKDVTVRIAGRSADSDLGDNDLYIGQRPDAWTVFCALNASYTVSGSHDWYSWGCKKEDFDSYPYFKVLDYPNVIPETEFSIKVAYRINDHDSWHEQTVSYVPAESCTFVVSGRIVDGAQQVVQKVYINPINLSGMVPRTLASLGYCTASGDDLTHLLLGWKEGDTEISGLLYSPGPGRHVIAPSEIVKIPGGCSAYVDTEYVGGDLGTVCYQTLSGVTEDSPAISTDAKGRRTLKVPRGFDKVSFSDACEVDDIAIPSTVLSIDAAGDELKVRRAYKVDPDNALYAATSDGVLTDKSGTEYYGIPTGMKRLVVPAGVTSVQIPAGSALKSVIIQATEDGSLPAIGDLSNLHDCNFVVEDGLAQEFIAEHVDAFGAATGNTVSLASRPDTKMSVDQGVITSGSKVWSVADTGSSWVEVGDVGSQGATVIGANCFADDPSAFTLVLSGAGSYTFEDGCFDGSDIGTIACATQAQLDYVERRLAEMDLAEDIVATMLETTDDGYVYYHVPSDGYGRLDANGDVVTLFKAPATIKSFDGTFVDKHGDTVKPELIASWAFAGCDQLEWVETSDATWYIGAEAFRGCDAVQGMFLGCRDPIDVEPNAFADCPRMKFLAARSMDGEFADECQPNSTCVMYAPTGAEGYYDRFTSFTPESNVADYSLAHQTGDNGFVLCGDGANGDPWLILGAGAELNGTIELPSTTIEIFSNAFSYVGGRFTVNWQDLYQLQWLDQSCFYASGVSGDIYLGDAWASFVNVQDNAFEYCDYITSLTSDALAFNLGTSSFGECFALERVKLAAGKDYSFGCAISASCFYECPSLTTIEFTNESPVGLLLPAQGYPFTFDGWVSADEDAERIRIKVPKGSEEAYVQAWGYSFAGYSGYDDIYADARQDLMNETLKTPSESEVKAEVSKRLLAAENRLRGMLGMPSVDRSTLFASSESDGFTFDTNYGVTTIAGLPTDAETIDLSKAIPDDVDEVTLTFGTFQNCTKLKKIILGTKVSKIETGAFYGCDGVEVVLPDIPDGRDEPSIELTGGDDWSPFDFGGDIELKVADASASKYLKSWTRQMLGINDEDSLSTFIHIQFWTVDDASEDIETRRDRLENATNTAFKTCENRLRAMMGIDQVDDYHDLASYVATDGYFDKFRSEDEDSDLPSWPDWPDDDAGDDGADDDGGDASGQDAPGSDASSLDASGSAASGSDDAVGDKAQGDKDGQHDDGVDAGTVSGEL